MKKLLCLCAVALFAVGCTSYKEIPAGFVGKVLTPSGWQKEIREAGMVDIGDANGGAYNTLVLLEATSIAFKESFEKQPNEDHRILINKTPIAVDVYIRLMVPADEKRRNAIFAQVTPAGVQNQDRVSLITVQKIYAQFAQMDVRSAFRAVLQKYTSVDSITSNLDDVNERLGAVVIKYFEKSGVPLLVQNVAISNVKPDETIWQAENQKAAALSQVEAINKIGAALRSNPEYMLFKKYDTYKEMANAGKVGTFTIIEGNPGGVVVGK